MTNFRKKSDWWGTFWALVPLVAFFALQPVCCELDAERAERVVKHAGLEDVEVGGFVWFCGDQADVFRTRWVATNPQGERVEGCVSCGWFKECTVRYDE